jgi:hypothetical protein
MFTLFPLSTFVPLTVIMFILVTFLSIIFIKKIYLLQIFIVSLIAVGYVLFNFEADSLFIQFIGIIGLITSPFLIFLLAIMLGLVCLNKNNLCSLS